MDQGTQEEVDNRAKVTRRDEASAFLALYSQFFPEGKPQDDGTILHVKPEEVEAAFTLLASLRVSRYHDRIERVSNFLKGLKEKDAPRIYNSMPKIDMLDGIAGDLLQGYREGLKDCLIDLMLANMVFALNRRDTQKWDALREEMQPFAEIMKKVKDSLDSEQKMSEKAGAPEFFETIWARQAKRGAIV